MVARALPQPGASPALARRHSTASNTRAAPFQVAMDPSTQTTARAPSIYDAYPLTLRSFLTQGPPPFERALSQPRLVRACAVAATPRGEDTMGARRMRELFERPASDANDNGVTSPGSRESATYYQRQRAERRSGNMCSRFGKFHGEVYETKERSRVMNVLKRRSRMTGAAPPQGGAHAAAKFSTDDVLRAGTLTKQGSWRRNWKTRFFLLRRDHPSLCYYKSEEKLELLGAIAVSSDTLVLDKSAGGHAPYRFQLRTGDASLLLEAETRENQQRWMDACQELVDAVRDEKFRQSSVYTDRVAATTLKTTERKSLTTTRGSLAATAFSSMASAPSNSMLKPQTPGRIGVNMENQEELHEMYDGSSDSSSDEEDDDDDGDDDNQKEEDEEDDKIWAAQRDDQTTSNQQAQQTPQVRPTVVVSAAPESTVASNDPHGPHSYDLVIELVLGRQSKLLLRSESSSDKLRCCVKVVAYSSRTKQTIEVGTTDAVSIASAMQTAQAAAVAHAADTGTAPAPITSVRLTFLLVLRADLQTFDQLRFTVYRASSSAPSSRTTVGLGRCFVDDDFRSQAAPKLVPLTEKSSSFPDIKAASSAQASSSAALGPAPSLLMLQDARTGSSSSLPINANSVQLLVQAFPSLPLHSVLPTSCVDMASTKYLLPTAFTTDSTPVPSESAHALLENGSFLTTASEAPAPPNARLVVVDEILRTPRSTFALPLAFLDYLEETALERTRILQKRVEIEGEKGDDAASRAFELEFYRRKLEEYLRQRQFLMKQEKRLLDEVQDRAVFRHTLEFVDRTGAAKAAKNKSDVAAAGEVLAPFKRSTYKSMDMWQFLPTNMQNQFMCVHQSGPAQTPFVWHTMTMGCPAAHTKGFASGGFPANISVTSCDPLPTLGPSSRSSNPASAGSDDDSGLTSSDNEHSLERASLLGTQLRRRTSRTSNSSSSHGEHSHSADSLSALKSRLELKDRLDIIASQTLSAAVACIIASLDLAVVGSDFHKQQLANASTFGYLINFESLLSTQGKEVGMIEDFAAGAKWLRNVFVQFRRHQPTGTSHGQFFAVKSYSPTERRGLAGGTGLDGAYTTSATTARDQQANSQSLLLVTIGVTDAQLAVLPPSLVAGKPFRMRCLLFTQGVNEKQSLVHALKSYACKVQDRVNRENLEELKEIYAAFRRIHTSEQDCSVRGQSTAAASVSRYSLQTLDDLLNQIEHHVCSSSNQFKKNVALLMDTSDFCRELGGARVTCCKSGKDRTAMSVTLEQARLCCSQLKMAQGHGKKLVATMRLHGVRRKNVFLNTKSNKFAFNEMQRKMLPDCYKPPAGTYKSGKT